MSKNNSKSIDKKYDFKPSIFYILSVITYLAGTLMPWFNQGGNIYNIASQIASWLPVVTLSLSVVFGLLMLLQIVNCITRKPHLKIICGVITIIASIVPWLTFLGSFIIISNHTRVGIGVYVTALGDIMAFISAIAILASNKRVKE